MTNASSNGNAYSQQKALYHTDRMEALRRGEQIVPTHVQCSISDLCSHDCSFCAFRLDGYTSNELFTANSQLAVIGHNNPKRMIPTEKCLELLDDCSEMGVKAFQATGGGSPTVHPDHHKIFKYAMDRGLEFSLVTHGCLLKQPTIDLLGERAAWVRVSLDAGCKETYASIRHVNENQFFRAQHSIRELAKAKRRLGGELNLGVGFVVTADNWREVKMAAEIAKQCGADSFRISAMFQQDNERYFDGFGEQASELCRSCEQISNDQFVVTNSFDRRLEDLRLGRPTFKKCSYMQFTIFIGGDMTAYKCCNTSYSKLGEIGSIANQRFKDLWDSLAKQENYNAFDPVACERCQFVVQNQAIESALSAPSLPILGQTPPHVNFV